MGRDRACPGGAVDAIENIVVKAWRKRERINNTSHIHGIELPIMSVDAKDDRSVSLLDKSLGRRWIRKAYLLPAEHGSWSWLLVPYLAGAGVAGQWTWATFLVLCGGLSVFLIRQPATAWLRIRQGRGRRRDEPVAMFWTVVFALLAILSLLVLLLLQRLVLAWLLPPVAALLMVYLAVAQINRARVRSLWMELAGAVGLAVMAPAAYAASSGVLDTIAWLLWGLFAVQNLLGVLYVRTRVFDTRGRSESRIPLLASHIVGLLLIGLALVLAQAPRLALAPFVFYSIRAIWVARGPRPIPDIRRFGFTEVAVELAAGLWLIMNFLIS
jgi:hypothetical protein